jgi:hypothetical protein
VRDLAAVNAVYVLFVWLQCMYSYFCDSSAVQCSACILISVIPAQCSACILISVIAAQCSALHVFLFL